MLSTQQYNVLEAIVEATLYRSGKRAGMPKRAIGATEYHRGTVAALGRRGLIEYVDNALGTRIVATIAGWKAIRE